MARQITKSCGPKSARGHACDLLLLVDEHHQAAFPDGLEVRAACDLTDFATGKGQLDRHISADSSGVTQSLGPLSEPER